MANIAQEISETSMVVLKFDKDIQVNDKFCFQPEIRVTRSF